MKKLILDNGLTLITEKIKEAKTSSVVVTVKIGPSDEPSEMAGISHFVEHMAFKGTRSIPDPTELSSVIENVGGFINASTDYDSTHYYIKAPSEYIEKSITLLFDMLSNSTFLTSSIENERKVITEEINSVNDFPDDRCELNLHKVMWPNTYLERDIAGSHKTLKSITESDLLCFYNHNYTADKIIVSVAGNIEESELISLISNLSKELPLSRKNNVSYKPKLTPQSGKIYIEEADTGQIHICFGYPGASTDTETKYSLSLLNIILGSGMSSLLFKEVREKRGLAYDIESKQYNLNQCGYLTITAGLSQKKLNESIELIENIMSNCYQQIDKSTLNKAKNMLKGRLIISMEDTLSIAEFNATSQRFGTVDNFEDHLEKINNVKIDEIKEIAHTNFTEFKPNIAIVGPVKELYSSRIPSSVHI